MEEACRLKRSHGAKSKFWAGGTDLLLQWRNGSKGFDYCIDLSFLSELDFIKRDKRNVSIGALTRVASIESSAKLVHSLTVIREGAHELATPQIRNTATIGGNLCNASPAADLAPPLLASGAEVKLVSAAGERWVPSEEFFLGVNKTALTEDELMAEIRVPIPPECSAGCFLKMGRTVIDIAMVNMAACITTDEQGLISEAAIAFGAVAPVPLRITSVEQVLTGVHISKVDEPLVDHICDEVAANIKPITDVRTSANYRREVSRVFTRRAIERIKKDLHRRRHK